MRITCQAAVTGALALTVLVVGLPAGAQAQQRVWNESEVVEALGIKERKSRYGNTISYFLTDQGKECETGVVLTTGSGIRMYKKIDDAVAVNPDGTAGVAILSRETRTCLEAATKLLEKLR